MATGSSIEWTQATWNPVTGCTRVSRGCDHCYAARLSYRLEAMGHNAYQGLTVLNNRGDRHFNGEVKCHPDRLEMPYRWRASKLVFVNSMSDLFHRSVPTSFIKDVFAVMNECEQHRFQVLTKRPERAAKLASQLEWTDNIWMGTSVEDDDVRDRIDHLRKTPAAVRFLSLEPLLGPLSRLNLKQIHWVIVGGESGPGARPMEESWAIDIQRQCERSGTAFFFKQWGGRNKKATGRELLGQEWNELPAAAS
jgi:protein gp37